jgi:hypothetical protein
MAHHIMSSGRTRIVLRAPEGDQRNNPFAPPPAGAPDRPWQPRQPEGPQHPPTGQVPPSGAGGHGNDGGNGGQHGGSGGAGGSDGSGGSGGTGGTGGSGNSGGSGDPQSGPPPPPPPVWGSQWSSRQPQSGRPDPFAQRPQNQPPSGPQGTGPRFDPTDPAHRRSRYALVCGGWGLIFALLGWTAIGLLLGALALYWGISALRMSPEDRASARATAASALAASSQTPRPAPPPPGPDAQRSFLTAAWTGVVTSAVALAIVAATYGFQLAYRDYYTCKSDALTQPAAHACSKLLPSPLRDLPAFRQ